MREVKTGHKEFKNYAMASKSIKKRVEKEHTDTRT